MIFAKWKSKNRATIINIFKNFRIYGVDQRSSHPQNCTVDDVNCEETPHSINIYIYIYILFLIN